MTFKAIFYLVLLSVVFIIFPSCGKSDKPIPPSTNSFIWTTGGTNYTATIDTAFLGTGYTITPFHIIAGFGTFPLGFERRIDFHLTSFNIGSYAIVSSAGSVNTLQYINDAGDDLEGISGTLNITANANNLLSGNFSVTLINSSAVTSPMTGSFTNMSIRP
jgi:hypothetical protein